MNGKQDAKLSHQATTLAKWAGRRCGSGASQSGGAPEADELSRFTPPSTQTVQPIKMANQWTIVDRVLRPLIRYSDDWSPNGLPLAPLPVVWPGDFDLATLGNRHYTRHCDLHCGSRFNWQDMHWPILLVARNREQILFLGSFKIIYFSLHVSSRNIRWLQYGYWATWTGSGRRSASNRISG